MNKRAFLTFFSTVLVVHGSVNYYIYVHGLDALSADSPWRVPYTIAFVFLASAFLAARFLQRVWVSRVTDWLDLIGAVWLGAMVYFLLAVIVIDVARAIDWLWPFLPREPISYQHLKEIAFEAVLGIVAAITVG